MKTWILIGAPGSGKSTWGQTLVRDNPTIVRLCPDEFRAKFGWGEGDQSVSAQAFSATRQGLRDALGDDKDVVIDACNMYRKARKEFLDIAKEFNATTIGVVFEADKQTLVARNQLRGSQGGRVVPDDVIERMLARYERPAEPEFSSIEFITRL